MADQRFFQYSGELDIATISEITGIKLSEKIDPSMRIKDVSSLEEAGPGQICFVENRKYCAALEKSSASACFLPQDLALRAPENMALLITDRPRRNFARVSRVFYPDPELTPIIHEHSSIAESANIADGCRVDAGVRIGSGVSIGEGCWIGANSILDDGITLGAHTRVGSNSSLSHCDIGARCYIYPGVRIGQPGFGFEADLAGTIKMPQLGKVIVQDDVEIGANSTVDRGAGPDTILGRGTMIDNLVQVGHNVEIGRGCIIVAQVGIAGSTKIGDYTVIGGQVGIAGHLKIGNAVQIAAQSGVTKNIPNNSIIGGSPAVPIQDYRRQIAAVKFMGRRAKK